jgi:hypothetical protein
MVYNYLKSFDEFPNARTEQEALGVSFVSITTVDDIIQVTTDLEVNHPDFMVAE